jgi:hypothetical protein
MGHGNGHGHLVPPDVPNEGQWILERGSVCQTTANELGDPLAVVWHMGSKVED